MISWKLNRFDHNAAAVAILDQTIFVCIIIFFCLLKWYLLSVCIRVIVYMYVSYNVEASKKARGKEMGMVVEICV